MNGMFLLGDILEIEPCSLESLHPGDIVVFKKLHEESKNDLITHRVVNVNGNFLRTRGDNAKYIDVFPVTQKNLIGKVKKFERKGKYSKVKGGIAELYLARSKYFCRRFLVFLYMKLSQLPIICKTLKTFLRIRFRNIKKISINSPQGKIIKWVYKQKVIAIKGPGAGDFYCQKPFDLIIKK